jgi:hypothetical protein
MKTRTDKGEATGREIWQEGLEEAQWLELMLQTLSLGVRVM